MSVYANKFSIVKLDILLVLFSESQLLKNTIFGIEKTVFLLFSENVITSSSKFVFSIKPKSKSIH